MMEILWSARKWMFGFRACYSCAKKINQLMVHAKITWIFISLNDFWVDDWLDAI